VIATLVWLAQIVAGPVAPGAASASSELPPPAVIERYEAALRKVHEPQVITFDYKLEQTGLRNALQTHRVYRSGNDERDETLTVDGKRLSPPKVRVFRGRRNRYTIAALAPRTAQYKFTYVGSRKDGHHVDYLFRLTPTAVRPFAVTDVAIDGVRFLPLSIGFATGLNDGTGTITFGSNARWWVPYVATARATVADATAMERLTFYSYRFPLTLPESTFTQARRGAPRARPVPLVPPVPAPAVPQIPGRPGFPRDEKNLIAPGGGGRL
jgi:hypothetical protein